MFSLLQPVLAFFGHPLSRGGLAGSWLFVFVAPLSLLNADADSPKPSDIEVAAHRDGEAIVVQKKTQRPVQFELTEQMRDAVEARIAAAHLKPEHYLFSSWMSESPQVPTRQYSRLVGGWRGRSVGTPRRTAPIRCGAPRRP